MTPLSTRTRSRDRARASRRPRQVRSWAADLECPRIGRDWGISGRDSDTEPTRLTRLYGPGHVAYQQHQLERMVGAHSKKCASSPPYQSPTFATTSANTGSRPAVRSEANEGRQDCSKRPYVALGCVALQSVALWCKAVWRVAFAVRRETCVDSCWTAQSPPQAAHENIVLGTQ